MLNRLRLFGIVFALITCVDVVYGKSINNIKDLLEDTIPIEYKLEYLNSIYNDNNYSFSEEDIDTLVDVFIINGRVARGSDNIDDYIELSGISDENSKLQPLSKSQIIKIMDDIRTIILKIFLRPDIDENILTQTQMSKIAIIVINELGLVTNLSKERRYLALKVLIKINELKTNSDDEISKQVRDLRKNTFSEQPDEIVSAEEIDELHEHLNFWDQRFVVEDYIFEPILKKYDRLCVNKDRTNNYYITEDKAILEEYEQYLLDHLKFFPINNYLQELVEEAFFNTQFAKFKSLYIDAMFALNMRNTLLNIILDTSIDTVLRIQAVNTAVKLLSQVELMYFKNFSSYLLIFMKKIADNRNEDQKLKKVVQEKIPLVQAAIAKHDEIKDLEQIIFDKHISLENRLLYLDSFITVTSSLQKKDLGIIKKILNDETLPLRIKAKIATFIVYRSNLDALSEELTNKDIESIWFLWLMVDNGGVDINNRIFKNSEDESLWRSKHIPDLSDEQVIQQAGKFGLLSLLLKYIKNDIEEMPCFSYPYQRNLLKYMNGGKAEINDAARKLAIKTSLDVLVKSKNFEVDKQLFLDSLETIANNSKESHELRNIADVILLGVKSGKLSLKEGSCNLNFIF